MKFSLIVSCALSLWAGAAFAYTPTAQQECDYARITAWKVYTSCIDAVNAKDIKAPEFYYVKNFARCRHKYFKKWTAFQSKAALAGSTCIGSRYTDNGDQTVTDALTSLVWEKKQNLDSTQNFGDEHDADNHYAWSSFDGFTISNKEDGAAFTMFLAMLNGGGFGGANGWRLPTQAELQTILRDFTCSSVCDCGTPPCIDATFGPTESRAYWSATSYLMSFQSSTEYAWNVNFFDGFVYRYFKADALGARAVRGGL